VSIAARSRDNVFLSTLLASVESIAEFTRLAMFHGPHSLELIRWHLGLKLTSISMAIRRKDFCDGEHDDEFLEG